MVKLIRSPDTVVGGLRFYCDSSFFFFRQLSTELTERNSTKTGYMFGNECYLKMHVQSTKFGVSPSLKIRLQKPHFSTTTQPNGNLNGLYFRKERRHRRPDKCAGGVSYTVLKCHELWPTFLPTLRKFCILLHCQASQTEISKRNSTKLCHTPESKSR